MIRYVVFRILDIIELLIIARAILSWFPIRRDNVLVSFLNTLTEPLLEPIRKLIDKAVTQPMMIDLSPIIAFLLIGIVRRLLAFVI